MPRPPKRSRARGNVRRDDPRVRVWNDRPVRRGDYVVYWCQAARRANDNVALELAIERANELGLPVVIYESLRPDYPLANDRLHRFVLECARDTAVRSAERGIPYGFFLPRSAAEARGVAAKVFARAALVVSDEHPSFIFPAQNEAAAKRAPCAYLTVDDNAVVPMSLFPAHESQARTLRPKIMAKLDEWLAPVERCQLAVEPRSIDWPFDPLEFSRVDLASAIAACEIDHTVHPVTDRTGGSVAANRRLRSFLRRDARRYDEGRDDVPADATSGLSPYLHFGAISARSCLLAMRDSDVPQAARDAFVEQLVVRRGLAFNHAARVPDHAAWTSVPGWARQTLEKHQADARPDASELDLLERARSNDALWNIAQRELIEHGRMHNVMRMFWGKRLLPLTRDPRAAFEFAVRMFDRYALDGRDPNTYAGVGWCFGLHDRPFPERPIFGTVRPMGVGALKKRFDIAAYQP